MKASLAEARSTPELTKTKADLEKANKLIIDLNKIHDDNSNNNQKLIKELQDKLTAQGHTAAINEQLQQELSQWMTALKTEGLVQAYRANMYNLTALNCSVRVRNPV